MRSDAADLDPQVAARDLLQRDVRVAAGGRIAAQALTGRVEHRERRIGAGDREAHATDARALNLYHGAPVGRRLHETTSPNSSPEA